jgi:hypothetical protein
MGLSTLNVDLWKHLLSWVSLPHEQRAGLIDGHLKRLFEIYDAVRALYPLSTECTKPSAIHAIFHFAHGDLSEYDILIDPDTGAVTGLIGWQMAGFRPAWLAAVAPGWSDNNFERFPMISDQTSRGNYTDDTPQDTIVLRLGST